MDDYELTPADLFATVMAMGNEVKIVTPQQLRDLGMAIDPDWTQDFFLMAFLGPIHGIEVHHPSNVEATGVNRVILTGQSMATLCAILTVYGREIVGKTSFTSMLDQELARVAHLRQTDKEGK